MALPLAVVFVFAPEILGVWLGAQYAAQSAVALRWLAAGVFANSLANPLFVALYAKDRPDLPAKFHLLELAIHVPLTIYLIQAFGIAGAAAAWSARSTLDMWLLLWGAARVSQAPVSSIAGGRALHTTAALVLLVIGFGVSKVLATVSIFGAVFAVAVTSIAFLALSWRSILGDVERSAITGTVASYLRLAPVGRRDGAL
jgi:O-antigen/teichoic acid export membrane protein